MKLIYCAGPLTPQGNNDRNPAIDYLANVRRFIRIGVELLLAGYAPFVPALDFMFFLSCREDEQITEERIKQYSLDWLEVSDAMLLTKGWQKSDGTLKEIEFAKERNIPIFESVEDLLAADTGEN